MNLTLAHHYAGEQRLAGTFFFAKQDSERDNFVHFVPTLASQLIDSIPELKAILQETLEKDSSLIHQSFHVQFKKLILDPLRLKKITLSGPPMVIIIDSLDDCKDSDVKEFLKLVEDAVNGGKFSFRLLIGSRSEAYLQRTFHEFAKKGFASILCLDKYAVEDDIRAFLKQRLEVVYADRDLERAVEKPWPSDDELRILLATAGHLFLHTVAIVAFIDERTKNPVQQLEIVLKGNRRKKATVFTSLDTFYKNVISSLPFDEHIRYVVGTISLLREPLSLNDVEKLLQLKKGASRQTLSSWQSFISNTSDQEDSSKPVQLVHTPLWQYLTDEKRSATSSISAALQHSQVAGQVHSPDVKGIWDCGIFGHQKEKVSCRPICLSPLGLSPNTRRPWSCLTGFFESNQV